MKSRLKFLAVIGFSTLIVGLLFFQVETYFPANKRSSQSIFLEKLEREGVPSFTGQSIAGTSFSLRSLHGKVVILNFWASWCNPCVQEFPSLVKIVEHFKGEVVFVGVSNDEDVKDVNNFLRAFGVPGENFEIIFDPKREISKQFGVEKLPESFLIGKDGKLIRKVVGIENWYTDDVIGYFSKLTSAQ